MNYRKPTPLADASQRAVCPVCGKTAYSRGGIHPQCGVTRADAELKAAQRAAASAVAALEPAAGKVTTVRPALGRGWVQRPAR
jgi:hypothetical protein